MTSSAQRDELHSKILGISNKVRGAVDGWDFKQYLLGILFYRFISENFTRDMNVGDDSINYAEYKDDDIPSKTKQIVTKEKGYFIYPSHLFINIVKNANDNNNLNTQLAQIFNEIESSAIGFDSEHAIKGLFADFDTTSNRLGNTGKEKNSRLRDILKGVDEINFDYDFAENQIDILVMSKHKTNTKIQFIDASKFYKKETNNNILTDNNIKQIIDIFDHKNDELYIATSIDMSVIAENDYNLAVSAYVEAKDDNQIVDINHLNQELIKTSTRINQLRDQIAGIINEIG